MSLVSLKITDGIKRILEEIKDDSLMESISGEIGEGKISIKSVKKVINHLKETTGKDRDLKKVFEGTSLQFKSEKSPEPNPELQKRREYLTLRQQQKEYNQMIFGADFDPQVKSHNKSGENPYVLVKNQVTISANMIVSVFVMFGIGYIVGGNMSQDETTKMIYGLVASISVMILEMTLFILRAVRMEDAFENNNKKRL